MIEENLEIWPTVLLDSVATRKSGHTPNKSHSEFWNGGIKWVSLADSSKLDDRYIETTDKQISALGIKNSSAVLLPAGTVILSRDAGVGKSAVLAEEMAVSQHFMAWICDERKTHNLFLYYWLQRKKPEFESIATGSTIKTIGLPYFKKLVISLPPFKEQCQIASILSRWDDSLSILSQLIDAKRQQKRGLAEQLLKGRLRLPGFDGVWEEKRLGEIFHLLIGGTPSRDNPDYWDVNNDTKNIWLSISDLKEKYISSSRERISNLGVKKSNVKLIPPSTVLMSFKLTLGRAAISNCPLYTNEAICAFVPIKDGSVDVEYFYQSIAIMNFLEDADIAVKGATMNKAKLLSFHVFLPPLGEQQAIAAVLSTLDSEISALEALKAKVAEQKRGLMDALLTGRVRVNVEDAS